MKYPSHNNPRLVNVTDTMEAYAQRLHGNEDNFRSIIDSIEEKRYESAFSSLAFPCVGLSDDKLLKSLFEAYAWYQFPKLRGFLYETFEKLHDVYYGSDLSDYISHHNIQAIHASATVFNVVSPDDIFGKVIDHFFDETPHQPTMNTIKRESEILAGDSPFEGIGLYCEQERACFEGGVEESNTMETEQKVGSWITLRQKGYSAMRLCEYYLVNKGDIHSSYRCSGVECQLHYMNRWLRDYIIQSGADASIFSDYFQAYKRHLNHDSSWQVEALYFDLLLELATSDSQIAAYVQPLILSTNNL